MSGQRSMITEGMSRLGSHGYARADATWWCTHALTRLVHSSHPLRSTHKNQKESSFAFWTNAKTPICVRFVCVPTTKWMLLTKEQETTLIWNRYLRTLRTVCFHFYNSWSLWPVWLIYACSRDSRQCDLDESWRITRQVWWTPEECSKRSKWCCFTIFCLTVRSHRKTYNVITRNPCMLALSYLLTT